MTIPARSEPVLAVIAHSCTALCMCGTSYRWLGTPRYGAASQAVGRIGVDLDFREPCEHAAAGGRALHGRTVSASGVTFREAALELEIVRVTGPY